MTKNQITPRNHIRVFVASTIYNFQFELNSIYSYLDNLGYDVYMSHKGTVLLDSKESNLYNCTNAVNECLKTGEKFARENYENHFNGKISEKTARNDISDLESGGWVRVSGQGPSTKYTRTNKELPDITG